MKTSVTPYTPTAHRFRHHLSWLRIVSRFLGHSGLPLCLLAFIGGALDAQTIVPDYMFPVIEDAGRMSIAAYGDKPELMQELRNEGWEVFVSASLPGGLDYTVWEKHLPGGKRELFVVFAGTDPFDIRDDIADLGQYSTGPEVNRQYRDALDIAKSFVTQADRDPGLIVKFAGHSLGGGLAQYVGLELGVQAIVFNAAPIQEFGPIATLSPYLQGKDRAAQWRVAENNVWNLRLRGDVVSVLPGVQYGRRFSFDPVNTKTGPFLGDYSRHSVQALLNAVLASKLPSVNSVSVTPGNRSGSGRGGVFVGIEIDEADFGSSAPREP